MAEKRLRYGLNHNLYLGGEHLDKNSLMPSDVTVFFRSFIKYLKSKRM